MNKPDVPTTAATPRRRRRWRWLILAALAVLLVVLHAPLLRFAGDGLVVDEPVAADCRLVILPSDEPPYDRAAELVRSGRARGVALVEWQPLRVQALGAMPRWEEIHRRELRARGLRDEQIELVRGPAATGWDAGRLVGGWLRAHPHDTLVVLTDRFSSRHDRLQLAHGIDPGDRPRLRVMALPHREYDETNWWRRKSGVLSVFNSYVRLAHAWTLGEGPPPPPRHPDDLDGLVP